MQKEIANQIKIDFSAADVTFRIILRRVFKLAGLDITMGLYLVTLFPHTSTQTICTICFVAQKNPDRRE